jgi:hypothetical protein
MFHPSPCDVVRNYFRRLVFIPATVYIFPMNFRLPVALLLAVSGLPLFAAAASAEPADPPYATIVERNVFGLVPIPTTAPVDPNPAPPPPKITPNGIMTVFGKLQVLFKVAEPAKGTTPAKDESYVMSEGDRENDIEVQKIDEAKAVITFDNHGVIQQLPLVASTAASGGPPPGPATTSFAPPGMSPGAFSGGPMGALGMAGRFGRNRPLTAAPAVPPSDASASQPFSTEGMTPTIGGYVNSRGIFQPAASQLSPEEQTLMIEAQRMKYQQEGNPIANALPPTAITKQLQNEAQNPPADPPPAE